MRKRRSLYASRVPRYRISLDAKVHIAGRPFRAVACSVYGHVFRDMESDEVRFITHDEVSMMMEIGEIEIAPVASRRRDRPEIALIRDIAVEDMRRFFGRRPYPDCDPND